MKRKYTSQFKENAIALSEQKGNSAEAARELGICSSVIRRWKKEKKTYANNSFPGHGNPKMTDQQREISPRWCELIARILRFTNPYYLRDQ